MKETVDRREFLRVAAGAGLALASGTAGRTALAQSAPAGLQVTELRGLVQISGAGGNVVALGGPDGVALVDSGAPERAADLTQWLAGRFGGAPVELLLNTHWHLPHTGGNDAFGKAGATIVAHEHTRLWMAMELYVEWENRTYPKRAPEALPTKTFYSSDPQPIEQEFGSERIVYGHLREAHTDGDIYVLFPEHNVIAAGGALTVGRYPTLDYITGGWIGGLIDATEKLLGMTDAETLIVPDVGPAQSRSALEAQLEMLSTVRDRIESMAHQGKGVDDMVAAAITSEFDARWGGDSKLFIANAYEGLWWGGRMRGIVA